MLKTQKNNVLNTKNKKTLQKKFSINKNDLSRRLFINPDTGRIIKYGTKKFNDLINEEKINFNSSIFKTSNKKKTIIKKIIQYDQQPIQQPTQQPTQQPIHIQQHVQQPIYIPIQQSCNPKPCQYQLPFQYQQPIQPSQSIYTPIEQPIPTINIPQTKRISNKQTIINTNPSIKPIKPIKQNKLIHKTVSKPKLRVINNNKEAANLLKLTYKRLDRIDKIYDNVNSKLNDSIKKKNMINTNNINIENYNKDPKLTKYIDLKRFFANSKTLFNKAYKKIIDTNKLFYEKMINIGKEIGTAFNSNHLIKKIKDAKILRKKGITNIIRAFKHIVKNDDQRKKMLKQLEKEEEEENNEIIKIIDNYNDIIYTTTLSSSPQYKRNRMVTSDSPFPQYDIENTPSIHTKYNTLSWNPVTPIYKKPRSVRRKITPRQMVTSDSPFPQYDIENTPSMRTRYNTLSWSPVTPRYEKRSPVTPIYEKRSPVTPIDKWRPMTPIYKKRRPMTPKIH
jgi:hypothetical protein